MPLTCAMLWWEILDRDEMTWKYKDKIRHNYNLTKVYKTLVHPTKLNLAFSKFCNKNQKMFKANKPSGTTINKIKNKYIHFDNL